MMKKYLLLTPFLWITVLVLGQEDVERNKSTLIDYVQFNTYNNPASVGMQDRNVTVFGSTSIGFPINQLGISSGAYLNKNKTIASGVYFSTANVWETLTFRTIGMAFKYRWKYFHFGAGLEQNAVNQPYFFWSSGTYKNVTYTSWIISPEVIYANSNNRVSLKVKNVGKDNFRYANNEYTNPREFQFRASHTFDLYDKLSYTPILNYDRQENFYGVRESFKLDNLLCFSFKNQQKIYYFNVSYASFDVYTLGGGISFNNRIKLGGKYEFVKSKLQLSSFDVLSIKVQYSFK